MLESLLNAFRSAAAWVLGKRDEESKARHEKNKADAEAEAERRKKEGKP
jgi:3'-phosphoadenosine 5'-phosphosulfate sulfotransferase (PAPS reductase)/FAD synthetase